MRSWPPQRRGARVTAVEGDRTAAEDLAANAGNVDGVRAVHQSVEAFVRSAPPRPEVVIVDPPRTGLSRDALQGLLRLRGAALSTCRATSPRWRAMRVSLVDAGYAIARIDGFDLFPNTPHVETVVVFER